MSVSGSVRSAARMTAATSSRGCDASRRGKRRLKSRDHPIAHYKCYGVAMTQLTYVYEGTDHDTGMIVVTSTVEPEPGEELDPEKPRDY